MLVRLPQAAFPRMAWKNGGGETAEIAIYPPGASLDNFAWRISRATVRASGPFSVFPEIDRTLCVLEGGGIELAFADGETATLAPVSAPYRFKGENAAVGHVTEPGIVDFNVMTRRGVARHNVARHTIDREIAIAVASDFLLVYAEQAPLVARLGNAECALARGDALIVAEAAGQTLALAAVRGAILRVDIWNA